jgi:hypothetical protein
VVSDPGALIGFLEVSTLDLPSLKESTVPVFASFRMKAALTKAAPGLRP